MAEDKYAKWFQQAKVTVKDAQLTGANEGETKDLDAFLKDFEKDAPLLAANDKKTFLKYNKNLLSQTFLVSNHVTLADLLLYTHAHSAVASWNEKDRIIFVNVTRWFDHIQFLVGRENALPWVDINPDCVPFESKNQKAQREQKQKKEAAPKKEGEKKEAAPKKEGESSKAPASKPAAPAVHHHHVHHESQEKREATEERKEELAAEGVSTATPDQPPVQQSKKEAAKGKGKQPAGEQQQQQGGKKGGGKKAAAPAEPAPQLSANEDISRLDIRVGVIRNCKKHDNADSLYVEEIDVGEDAPRTVVSGLVKFVPLDQMQNRMVLLLCNLKPSKMRGVLSQAMVLAASNADHTQVELVEPPAGAKIGEKVTFAGFPGEPEKVLKEKTQEVVYPDMKTNDDKVATYKGVPFTTSAGVCTVKSITNGGIK